MNREPSRESGIERRSLLRLGVLGTMAAVTVLIGGHGGHHEAERRRQLDNAADPEQAALERVWHQGFVERGGEQLLAAMRENLRDPAALQAYFDRMKMSEGLTDMEATFRCMDDRICTCGSCSAGSLVLEADAQGRPRYVPPARVADKVLASPIAARTGRRPITYTKHLGGCGGDKIAMGILHGRDPADISDEEVAAWGAREGRAVVDALTLKLKGARPAEFRQLGFADRAMEGPRHEHAGQVIYVTAHRTKQLDPRFTRLPVGMQLDAMTLNERNLTLNVLAGVRILHEHGPHREPIMVVGMAERDTQPQLAAALRRTVQALPADHRRATLAGTVTA